MLCKFKVIKCRLRVRKQEVVSQSASDPSADTAILRGIVEEDTLNEELYVSAVPCADPQRIGDTQADARKELDQPDPREFSARFSIGFASEPEADPVAHCQSGMDGPALKMRSTRRGYCFARSGGRGEDEEERDHAKNSAQPSRLRPTEETSSQVRPSLRRRASGIGSLITITGAYPYWGPGPSPIPI